jgi:hypothetical protein
MTRTSSFNKVIKNFALIKSEAGWPAGVASLKSFRQRTDAIVGTTGLLCQALPNKKCEEKRSTGER